MLDKVYEESDAAVIVYDVTNRKSFENVREWLGKVRRKPKSDKCIYYVVGNKADAELKEKDRAVSF